MNAFSLFDRCSQAQMTLLQAGVPLIQQPNQVPSLTSTNLVGSLSGNLFAVLLISVWVAVVFFHIGVKVGRGQTRIYDRTAVQRQIQNLEKFWQLSAKRKN